MLGKIYEDQVCSIARTLDVVGERWSLLLVRDALFAGVTRFGDFQHNLGVATNVLASRLDAFVVGGIMVRHRYSERPEQYEYLLTERGRDLGPALVALTVWGDRWASPDGPPILYEHSACGEPVRQDIACAHCGIVDASELAVRAGPGMPAEYLANRRPRRAQRGIETREGWCTGSR
ncbi:MAG: winged helix-turn-helix transcriptional regulator [Acidimicrobiales bacterium]